MIARFFGRLLLVCSVWLLAHGTASACHVTGKVVCGANGAPVQNVVVVVHAAATDFWATGATDADGNYAVYMPDTAPGYEVWLDLSQVGGGTVLSPPAPAPVAWIEGQDWVPMDWTVDVPGCQQQGCWLTAGGAKFSTVASVPVAERGPRVSFGGNVNPSCSSDPGAGGQWSHVDHAQKLFFQGQRIEVVRCGNVPGLPPGSTSPVTPYDFIEFRGSGVLKGIAGNRLERAGVCFEARAEDRNEPGSAGQRDGALKDRYFLRVFDCNAPGATLLVLESFEGSGEPAIISDGNLQLHVSSCTP